MEHEPGEADAGPGDPLASSSSSAAAADDDDDDDDHCRRLAHRHALGGLVATLGQAAVTVRKTTWIRDAVYWQAAQPTAFVFFFLVLLPAAWPGAWHRHMGAIAAASRIGYGLLPTVKSPRSVVVLLQNEPQPGAGLRGLLRECWQVLLGTRCVALFGYGVSSGSLMPLPVTLDLALLLFCIYMIHDPAALCATPLLSHPIWRRRLAIWHASLHMLMPTPWHLYWLADPANGATSLMMPHEQCHLFVSVNQLVFGVVAPLMVGFKARPPPRVLWWQEWRAVRRRLALQLRPPGCPPPPAWRRCLAVGRAALHCGYAAAEAGLQTVCSSLLECSSLHQLCLNTLALISTVYLAALAIS